MAMSVSDQQWADHVFGPGNWTLCPVETQRHPAGTIHSNGFPCGPSVDPALWQA